MQLFLNSILVGTNASTTGFDSLKEDDANWIGRDQGPAGGGLTLSGSIAEFRVWRVQRTAAQIRETMTKPVTGTEPDLVGLWNFSDPANPGRDFSPAGHHGRAIRNRRFTRILYQLFYLGE